MYPPTHPQRPQTSSRRRASAALLWLAAAAACSAPPGGAAPELTYTQAATFGAGANQQASQGSADPPPFSSLPLASLTVEWGDAAMATSNPTGAHLFSGLNADLCLDVPYGKPANGTNIHIYQCNLISSAQTWSSIDGQLRVADTDGSPYCLSLSGGSLNANIPITVTCTPLATTTDPTQLWVWEGGLLRLADSNQCLGLTANTTQNNLPLQTYPCDSNNATQQWRIGNLGIGPGNAFVTLGVRLGSQLDSNACIDLRSDDTSAGIVQSFACNPSAAQKWVFERGTLSNQNNSCIGLDGSATAGTKVKVTTCQANEPRQQWVWSDSRLVLANTDLCMCVSPGLAALAGQQLELASCPTRPDAGLSCRWLMGLP